MRLSKVVYPTLKFNGSDRNTLLSFSLPTFMALPRRGFKVLLAASDYINSVISLLSLTTGYLIN
jgi:hypothetical protein